MAAVSSVVPSPRENVSKVKGILWNGLGLTLGTIISNTTVDLIACGPESSSALTLNA